MLTLAELGSIYVQQRPTIVHHVAVKPVIYGTVLARLTGVRGVINALAGLGFVYTHEGRRAKLRQSVFSGAFRAALGTGRSRVIFQNPDDRSVLVEHGAIDFTDTVIVRGSGVDIERFRPNPTARTAEVPLVVYGGRMLYDKGLKELADAGAELRRRGVAVRIALVGRLDPENPAGIPGSDTEAVGRRRGCRVVGSEE